MAIPYQVDGLGVTKMAREKCYKEGNISWAMRLLIACLQTNQLEPREIEHIAFDILNGKAEIRGTYPNDDYGVDYLDEQDKTWNFFGYVEELQKKIEDANEQCNELEQKFSFMLESLPDYQKDELNREYYNAYEEPLFGDEEDLEDERPAMSGLLSSFMERMHDENEDDYGWLEPDGTFHVVEFGEHQKFAQEYLNEKYPFDKFPDMYWLGDKGSEERKHIVNGDVLVYKLNWVLLDNPAQGVARVTRDTSKRLTKAQKEFLYDYYTKRNRIREANAIFSEDE